MRWLLFFALLLMPWAANARDLDGRWAASPLHDWYSQQRNQMNEVCCAEAEWFAADDWGHEAKGYWVRVGEHRWSVPDEKMVRGMHPEGLAGVWLYPIGTDTLRCFVPGMEG